jgi:hypothetical protein
MAAEKEVAGFERQCHLLFFSNIEGKMVVKLWVQKYGGYFLLCFCWEAVQQLTHTQRKVPLSSNGTEQHVNVLPERRLRQKGLPDRGR